MAIQKSEESANPSLKAVIRLLDLAPVVNEELLSLADYMKKIFTHSKSLVYKRCFRV